MGGASSSSSTNAAASIEPSPVDWGGTVDGSESFCVATKSRPSESCSREPQRDASFGHGVALAEFAAFQQLFECEFVVEETVLGLDAHLVGQPFATGVRAVGQPEGSGCEALRSATRP